jgi:catecholate siderophore receptor
MKKNEDFTRLRGKLMLTGTLAMFAMGTMQGEAPLLSDKDEAKPVKPGTDDAAKPEEQTQPSQLVHKFDVPAGPLAEVMEAIQKQAGVRIELGSVTNMSGMASPGVHGTIKLEDALAQALENTGLAARFEGPDSVLVEMRGNQESVVVTANSTPNLKYTAPLVDLPQTITVVSEETMQQTASSTLMEALRTVPGITFGAGEGGNPLGDRPFIRGVDSQSSTYIDGIRDIAAQSREVFDVESVEVQEGPGGAYGGRGTGGGSINLNSKLARRDNFIAGSFMPGTSNYKRGTVDGNLKMGAYAAGRLTGMWHSADVAGRDAIHTGRWGVAPSLAIGLGHPSRLYLDYYHLATNSLPDSGIPYNNPLLTAAGPAHDSGTMILKPGDGQPITLPHRNIFYGLKDRDHDNETAKVATGRVERDLWSERALVRNSFRYERTSQDYVWTLPDDSQGNLYYGLVFRRINSRMSAVFTLDNQTDLSGSFKTGSIKHTYAAGMEFSKERGNNDAYTNNTTLSSVVAPGQTATETCPRGVGAVSGYNCTSLYTPDYNDPWIGASSTSINSQGQLISTPNSLTKNHNPTHSSSATRSAYAFDTVVFSQHFQGTFGARYDHYDSIFSPAKSATAIPTQEVVNNIGTYIAGLVYKPDQATSVYGTVSTAAIPTGNALAQGTDTSALSTAGNANLQPTTIRQEEFGAKRELGGGRALARVDFFRTDIQNVRITDANGNVSVAGTDRTLGAQIGISGMLTKKWQFTGGYTYLDAILTNAPTSATGANANGQAMPNQAKHSVAITSSYHLIRHLNVGGGIYGMTRVWGSQLNNKWVPGYVREDLFGTYEFNKHFVLQANILNLSDKLYYQQAYATHYAIMAPGRSAIFGFNVKF